MKERPILFKADVVNAILEGRKTQTRRILQPSAGYQSEWLDPEKLHSFPVNPKIIDDGVQFEHPEGGPYTWVKCPYGESGDRLWVREAFRYDSYGSISNSETGGWDQYIMIHYRADDGGERKPSSQERIDKYYRLCIDEDDDLFRPSVHMPRWASRITLEITNVKVERVQDISEDDCWSEGVERSKESTTQASTVFSDYAHPKRAFNLLWDSINKRRGFGWDTNPWLWALEFKRVDQ